MITIDILFLVERLEALLGKGVRVPMTSKTMIDEDEFLDIVDQMRIAIPEEIKLAKKLQQDRDRMLAQAQEEAARLIALAKEDAANLVNEHAVTKGAQELAEEIEGKARAESETIRRDADAYAAQVLSQLHGRLDQMAQQIAALQNQVYNGLAYITEKSDVTEETPEIPATVDEPVS